MFQLQSKDRKGLSRMSFKFRMMNVKKAQRKAWKFIRRNINKIRWKGEEDESAISHIQVLSIYETCSPSSVDKMIRWKGEEDESAISHIQVLSIYETCSPSSVDKMMNDYAFEARYSSTTNYRATKGEQYDLVAASAESCHDSGVVEMEYDNDCRDDFKSDNLAASHSLSDQRDNLKGDDAWETLDAACSGILFGFCGEPNHMNHQYGVDDKYGRRTNNSNMHRMKRAVTYRTHNAKRRAF